MSIETDHAVDEALHGRADDFVSGMDRGERVTWLKTQGFTDMAILDCLLDPEDPELDELCRDTAHAVAAEVANGARATVPTWLS